MDVRYRILWTQICNEYYVFFFFNNTIVTNILCIFSHSTRMVRIRYGFVMFIPFQFAMGRGKTVILKDRERESYDEFIWCSSHKFYLDHFTIKHSFLKNFFPVPKFPLVPPLFGALNEFRIWKCKSFAAQNVQWHYMAQWP